MSAAPPGGPSASAAEPPALVWHRMHPVTPALRAWKIVAALIALLFFQFGSQLSAGEDVGGVRGVAAFLVVVAFGAVVGGVYSAVAWRVTRYALDSEKVYLQTGVLFRRQRQARLDRVQAVDVVQPLLARIVGLAQLTIEQAGGEDSHVALAYLTESRAQELRNEILALAAGIQFGTATQPVDAPPDAGPVPPPPRQPAQQPAHLPAQQPALQGPGPVVLPGRRAPLAAAGGLAPEAPEREVLAVPPGRVLGSILLSSTTATMVLAAIGVLVLSAVAGTAAPLGIIFPIAFAGFSYAWTRFSGEFAFRAAISPDGIRLRHGLTESRAQTVPPGRVQAVRLVQPLLWRGPDWWRVRINVAGYASGDASKESVLLPVGSREEALLAVWLVLPDLGEPDPRALLEAGMTGKDDAGGFIPSPRRARWLDPIAWRRNGLRMATTALLLRSGRITRQLDLVPHERTQSLGLTQGPLQRLLRVSSFVVHSTPGPVSPSVPHLDAPGAAELLLLQAERARTARASAGPEQWMRRD